MSLIAITREVSPAVAEAQLTHLPRVPIDFAVIQMQHGTYECALANLGCAVRRLAVGENMPDAMFVEDIAVVLDEVAIITRPGAESRRTETAGVEEALKHIRLLGHIEPPGTLDGGDVLVAGRTLYVGSSERTNAAGIDQFRRLVEYFGYTVKPVAVRGCLHLKSAATLVAPDTVLLNRQWIPADAFDGLATIDVDPAEPGGANAVLVHDKLLFAEAFPRTRERLESRGCKVTAVDMSEIAKAEGAVTCCSLIFQTT
jgi:dimethylargininase